MATDRKIEPKLSDAAAKTTGVLETLRSRLSLEAKPTQDLGGAGPSEVPDDLDRQLEQYFATRTLASSPASSPTAQPKRENDPAEVRIPSEIRTQVIDGVVESILRSWNSPAGEIPADVKTEVIARLVEHVLGEMLKQGAGPR